MEWFIGFIVSVAILLLSAAAAAVLDRTRHKCGRLLNPQRVLFIGVMLSAVVLFIPVYLDTMRENDCGTLEMVLLAVNNMIKLFVAEGSFENVTASLVGLSPMLHKCYTVLFAVLFAAAPLMTFGFVLSFVENINARKRYITSRKREVYIFSRLNDRSLALAESLCFGGSDRLIVFSYVRESDDEHYTQLAETAKELGALCFKDDILTANFTSFKKRCLLRYFTISEDHSENTSQALKLIERLKYRENTYLYVFSDQTDTELILSKAVSGDCGDAKLIVRRINEVQSLINRTLYDSGYDSIFRSARTAPDGVKDINAVVVGMGKHGTEMTRLLPWFCQMTGYRVRIDSFDADSSAEDRFRSICPELTDDEHNNFHAAEGDAQYSLKVHSGVDAYTKTFDDAVAALTPATYVLVALGSDEKNVSVAVKLRSLYAGMGYFPVVQAIVYDSEKSSALSGATNFKNQPYNIDFIGDIRTSYSEKVILSSDLERIALERHLKWGDERGFWQYEYNYSSSVASAIHSKMKKLCGVPGIDKDKSQRTDDETYEIRVLEHCRWSAYMRSQGYSYGETRDDIAKHHHCLIPFNQLPVSEQEKDDD